MGASGRRISASLVVLGMLATAGGARAQTQQERQRSQILDELGLKKKPPAPPPPPAPEPPGAETSAPADEKAGEGKSSDGKAKGRAPTPAGPSFTRVIAPMLAATCKPCHTAGGPAAATHLLLTGDAENDHRAVARFADLRAPESSALLKKSSGEVLHGGGAPWPAGSPSHERLLAWIRAGARLDRAAPVQPPAPETVIRPAERREPRATAEPTPPAPPGPAPAVAGPALAPAPAVVAPVPASSAPPTFAAAVEPTLMNACGACHRTGGPAGMTRLLLSGDALTDEAIVRALVDPQAPEASSLLVKAAGQMHAGGTPLGTGDPRRPAIVAWIAGLASPPPAAPAPGAAPPAVAVRAAPAPPPPRPAAAPPAGLELPLGFLLNGRFDLNYERRQFSGNPFDSGSVAALRSYHHFLFLSREAGEPCGLSVEVLTLLFWEGHCRLPWHPARVSMNVAGGKIVVPFGADPLFHQSYGGLAGFDQVVLPPVWSIEGIAAHAVYGRGSLAVTDDLYAVRGYALQQADGVLNLQNGFSPDDSAKLAVGNRLGVAWMGLSAWYSAYFNPLGFGRRLFMQAVDVNIWRQRQIPVLGHFSLGFGLLRADVSGGGPGVGGVGRDYYDFADYLQLRYHPVDWLFLQYRTGLFTFDNRRALVLDSSRLTNTDGSTHNFGIVARTRHLWFGIFYFINLEKVNEVRNDLLRFNVTYEF